MDMLRCFKLSFAKGKKNSVHRLPELSCGLGDKLQNYSKRKIPDRNDPARYLTKSIIKIRENQ